MSATTSQDGTRVTVTFDEPIRSSPAPDSGLRVEVDDAYAGLRFGAYTVSGRTVSAELSAAVTVAAGQSVTVEAGRDSGIYDLAGNPARARTIPAANIVPAVTLTLTPDSMLESAGTSTVTATLKSASTEETTVTVTVTPQHPAVAGDITVSTNRTLRIAAGATSSTGVVTIAAVDNDTAAAAKTITVSATVSGEDGYEQAPISRTLMIDDDDSGGICARTRQVREAILARIEGVTRCADVTKRHLRKITGTLNLRAKGITSLRTGDLAGLSSVSLLDLYNNALRTLPPGLLKGMSDLRIVYLDGNRLRTLPGDLLAPVPRLDEIWARKNELTAFPHGIFRGNRQFNDLQIYNNPGDPTLESIDPLDYNHGSPLGVHVGLEPLGDGEFKIVVPTGTPCAMVVSLEAANGTLDDETVTIQAGRMESEILSITRTEGTTGDVTVDITDVRATVPDPRDPDNALQTTPIYHNGYVLTTGGTLPATVIAGAEKQVSIAAKDGAESVTEGTPAVFTLTRQTPHDAALTVTVSVEQTGSVIKTEDAYEAPTEATFGAGEGTATLTVETQADADEEEDGTITATVSAATDDSYTVGIPSTATVTVTREEETQTPEITATQVPADWSLIPEGLSSGDRFRLLIVTSTKRHAKVNAARFYDTHVQRAVAAGHADIQAHSAAFHALGCTSSVDAQANTQTTWTAADRGVPIYWLGGAQIADDYGDLYDGAWASNEAREESGAVSSHTKVFTGCESNGSTGDAMGKRWVDVGRPGTSGGELHSGTRTMRSLLRPLYGLSPVLEIAPPAPTPEPEPAVLTGFVLVDASTDADLGAVADDATVSVSSTGSYGIRAEVDAEAAVRSVKLTLEGPGESDRHERTEGVAPYSLYGDAQGAEHGEALAAGSYTLTATAYAQSNATGDELGTLEVSFTVEVEAAPPVLTGFVLVDASSDADLGGIAEGDSVSVEATGSYGIRAEVDPNATIGSVKLSLRGPGADDVHERTEGVAPYSLYGDAQGAEHGQALAAGSYTLAATTYAESGGRGEALGTYSVAFTVTIAAPADADGTRAGAVSLGAQTPARGRQEFRGKSLDRANGDAVDYYTFSTDGVYELGLGVRDQSIELKVVLEDATGTTVGVAGPPLNPNLDQVYLEWLKTVIDPGTYYIRVEALKDGATDYYIRFGLTAGPALSVADTEAEEGVDDHLDFVVSLDRASSATVTVAYATADGTGTDAATAGSDYTATSGRLTFAPGDTEKTVSVPVLEDGWDEGEETMTLTLSNASGATIADGVAIGTITNDDPIQKMWLARFGRTVGSQVVDAVAERLGSPLTGAQVTLGGQGVDLTRTEDGESLAQAVVGVAHIFGAETVEEGAGDARSGADARDWRREAWDRPVAGAEARSMTGREVLLGSAFHWASGDETGGPGFTAWGRVTAGGFDAEEAHRQGSVQMDGEVTTGIVGADAAWERWLAGLAVSVSEGEGRYAYGDVGEGKLESTLTGVHPYARVSVNERVQAWGLLGFGSGEMTMRPEGHDPISTDIDMRLGAVGAQGALMQAGETGGVDLVLKADAFLVQMESAKAPNTEATQADASRLRLALEGSRTFALGPSAALTPGLEVGLRHDGGDAETGTGVELGGRIAYANAASGLSVEARARTLIAHEDSGYEEWGASGSVRLDPGASGRGVSLTLAPTLGAASSGVERLWSLRDAQELATDDEFEAEGRLDAEVGYGLPVFGALTGTPYAGLGLSGGARDYRLGWRLTPGGRALDFELGLEGTWSVPANDEAEPQRAVMLRGGLRW